MSPETYLIEHEITQNKILENNNQYKYDSTNDHKINDKINFEYILYEPDRNNKNDKHKLKFKDHVILSGEITDIAIRKPNEQNTYTVKLEYYTSISEKTKTTLPYSSLQEEIKDLLPETILITENRLDRYGVFRELRETEIQINPLPLRTFEEDYPNFINKNPSNNPNYTPKL